MIHDLIPIEFPQFTAPKTTVNFGIQMQALTQNADFFIYNSTDTKQRMQRRFEKWGTSVDGRVVLLESDPLPFTDKTPLENR